LSVVIWARVSSREQREGYSIAAQLRATRDKADREGWLVVREFVIAESARRGAARVAFNDMLKWIRANAKRERISAILSHKLDRVCRNMPDAVRLQELEDACGVQLAFVEHQFGPGAAGALSFNVMAAVAQYYSDNLRLEVIKGMDEKVRQGWPTGLAPYGYMNVKGDREEPVRPHPEKAKTVIRIFELYARGDTTFEQIADELEREGHVYRKSQPRFTRTALSYILKNRFYIGEIVRNGQTFEGRYHRLITRYLFNKCQEVLQGRNRRTGKPSHPFAGGLLRCDHCGFAITGERVRRKLRNGSVREHLYYRCANNNPDPGHPRVRWRAKDLDVAIGNDLATLQIEDEEIRSLLRETLSMAFQDITVEQRKQAANLAKRHSELEGMQDRLLNAYLAGTIDCGQYRDKSVELRAEVVEVTEARDRLGRVERGDIDAALAVFDWSQNVTESWQRSNSTARREFLTSVTLNRTLSATNLCLVKRKPFDLLAKELAPEISRSLKMDDLG